MMDYEKIFYTKTPTNRRKGWAYFKQGTSGSFATALCHAYELGDLENRRYISRPLPKRYGNCRRCASIPARALFGV